MSITRHQAVGAYRPWVPEDFGDPSAAKDRQTPSRPEPHSSVPAAVEASQEQVADAFETEQQLAAAPEPGDRDEHSLQTGPEPAAEPGAELPEQTAEQSPAGDEEPPEAGLEAQLPADFQLPTAAEIERMHEDIRAAAAAEGHEEGQRAGFAEGLAAGQQQGYEEGIAQARAQALQLSELLARFEHALHHIEADIAEELMALAIELARQMVHDRLEAAPELILDTIHQALQELPHGQARIELHPDDLALATELIGTELSEHGHRLHENPALQRGDCLIEVEGAQLDASLETRWRRILETLGREHEGFRCKTEDAEAADQDQPPVVAAQPAAAAADSVTTAVATPDLSASSHASDALAPAELDSPVPMATMPSLHEDSATADEDGSAMGD